MKKIITISTVTLVLFLCTVLTTPLFADQPPNPGGGPGGGDDPVGGGAPIGSGLVMLIGLGIAYGAKRTFHSNKL